jgi:putative methyltransferase (TIGR04325 family)
LTDEALNFDYVWQLKFKNFSDAVLAQKSFNNLFFHQSGGGGFDSTQWSKKQASMLDLAQKGELPRPTSIVEFLVGRSIQNIVDFGGGPGWLWAYLVKSNVHHGLNYYNLELESSRIAFEFLTHRLPNMKFIKTSEVANLADDKNLLYSNSVLQYFEDNCPLLEVIKYLGPSCIVLDDIAGDEEEFYSLQNYYGFLQVNRFLNLKKLILEVSSMGYELLLSRKYEKDFSSKMIPEIWIGSDKVANNKIPSSVTLVFERI